MKTVFIVALLLSVAFARSTTKERISRLKCQEYNELYKKNNICNSDEYPFIGGIGIEEPDKNITWTCVASLVSDQYVLTTASCAWNINAKSQPKFVRLGGDFSKNSEAKIFNIAEIILHPGFKRPNRHNDIALFKLEKLVDFTKSIQPACLYTGEDLTEYDFAGFSFWTETGQKSTGSFTHEKILVTSKEECNKTYQGLGRLPDGVNFDRQFCNIEEHDTCSLNTAAVYLEKDKELSCMQNIAGLMSTGMGHCGGIPRLNVKVSAYVHWIESVVWP